MYQTNTSGLECGDAGDSLQAGLLITTTSSQRYKRLWQRGICVGLFITIRRSSPSYAPLPQTPTPQQQLSSRSSSQSEIKIDISSDSEAEILRHTVDRIVKEKDLNSLRRFGGTERVVLDFGLAGLSGREPKAWNTSNPVLEVEAKGFLYYLLKSCNSYTIFLLLISAGLSLVTEMLKAGPKYGWLDGATILVAVFLLVTVPSVTNFRRARKLEKQKLMREKRLEVIRNGESQRVAMSNIVEGDIVLLKEGDRVPGDGLYVGGDGLVLDEVLDSNIHVHHNPFLFSGLKVIEGNGRMIVTSVGTNTSIGKVMSMVKDDPNEPTLLQNRIEKPNDYADKIALCMSILITLVMFLRLRNYDDGDHELPELKGKVPLVMKIFEKVLLKPRGLVSILTTSLTAVVLGFQHEMSLAITISFSCWNKKIVSNHHANPQNLSACGTTGFATVICIDVSGGLNQMEVGKFLIGETEKEASHGDADSETSQIVIEALQRGIGMSDLLPENLRCPTDGLLNSWVESKWGVSMDFSKESFAIVDSRKLSFMSSKGSTGVLMRKNIGDDETIMHLHWKGSAETILGMCSHYYDCGGRSHALEDRKSKFEQVIKDMEGGGLTPIAFAYKQMKVEEVREDGLILLALVGFKYTIREETKSAVEALTNAGVSIKLVSVDELRKAKAIACELGVGSNNVALELEGEEFRNLNIDARKKMVDQITVMGKSLPGDKLLLVQCLKEEGHVVAFYGGLTTGDTPALKEADVGITEGTLSTEMARESSDIIVTSSGLCSLPQLLKYGRCVYHNIQKFIQLQITACISGVLTTTIVTICSGESPITAIQLIWVNSIICILGGMMMVMELRAQALLMSTTHQPQAKRTKSVMSKVMWTTFVIQVFYQVSVLLMFQYFKGQAMRGMVFNTFTLCQVFNLFNAMELEKKEVFVVVIHQYHWFLVALGVVMVMQVLVVEFAAALVADYVRLNWVQWAICILFALLSWGFDRAMTFILVFLSKWSIGSIISLVVWSSARTPPTTYAIPYMGMGFMFFMVVSSFSYYFIPDVARAFR